MSSPRDLRDFMLEHSIFLKFNILMKLYLMQLIQGPSAFRPIFMENKPKQGGWVGHSYISPPTPYTIPTSLHNFPLLVKWEIACRSFR